MSKRIMLLLGSGITVPSGQPNMAKMTGEMLEGNWYFDNSKFLKGTTKITAYRDCVPEVQKVLSVLKVKATRYFNRNLGKNKHTVHYEDLYYLANQLRQENLKSYYNPAVSDFYSKVKTSFKEEKDIDIDRKIDKYGASRDTTYELTCSFINNAVFHLLLTDNNPQSMNFISSICKDTSFAKVDIVTLNLDLLIEKQLKNSDISNYEDGFYKDDGCYKDCKSWFWNMNRFIESSNKIKLYKLHGSIDYFYGPLKRDPKSSQVYKYTKWEGLNKKFNGNPEVVILNGTGNKMFAYGMGFFNQMMCCFEKQLYAYDNNTLVVSGYGFGDFAINQRILTWLLHSKSNKLFVFHEYQALNIEGYFNNRFNAKVAEGRIIVKERFLGDIDYDVFTNILNNKKTHKKLKKRYLDFIRPKAKEDRHV